MTRIARISALFLFNVAAAAAAPATSRDEARLIGAWQEGMTQRLAQGTPEQRAMARKAGLLGAITVFKEDHRFELHPPCGAKQDDLRKVGLKSVPGTWQLSDAGELSVTIGAGQRSIVTRGTLQWRAGQMAWVGTDGRLLQKLAGKYDGPLPPTC
jgi:hypothetical protein